MTRAPAFIPLVFIATCVSGLGGCSVLGQVADERSVTTEAASLQPGRTRTKDVEQLWGPPRTLTVFKQGHQVWHYYRPAGGMSWKSALPATDLMSTERGRPATEVVLLFSADLALQQLLVRELPGPTARNR